MAPVGICSAQSQSQIEADDTLIIGQITRNPAKQYWKLLPIARYAASQMADIGIAHADVKMAPTIEKMAELVRTGEVDWVTESAFGATELVDRAQMTPMLLRNKKGSSHYRSVLIVRKESGIKTVYGLSGKKSYSKTQGRRRPILFHGQFSPSRVLSS
jgi:ABC-type phosphate/phosphonate transport system substrate-binding protein